LSLVCVTCGAEHGCGCGFDWDAPAPVDFDDRHPLCNSHSVASWGACDSCDDLALEPQYATKYGVACLVYYDNPQYVGEAMSDARFDGIADWLLKHESYKRIKYLDYDMLRAGSGFDPAMFPPEIHEMAGLRMGMPCQCRLCLEAAADADHGCQFDGGGE